MHFDAANPRLPIATLAAGVFLNDRAPDRELRSGRLLIFVGLFGPNGIYHIIQIRPATRERAKKETENQMKETTLSKITASVRIAEGTAERVEAASPNPPWTEHELQTVDEWITRQDGKCDRLEAIRRLVELGLRGKAK
jgi:hypothetical protein